MKSVACLLIGLGALCALPAVDAQPKADDKPAISKRGDLFGPDKLWTIHLKLGAKEHDAMQPKGGGMMMFPFPKKDDGPPKKKDDAKGEPADTHKNKGFGIEFPFVKGDLEFEGTLVKDIGIRYKGNSTYTMSAQGLKRPLKLDINHYVEGQKLHGLNGLSMGNGVADATRIREALAFSIFRAADVPASRTAFAKLYLTVTGKYDKTYVGLYTLIEPVDKTFLKEHFKSDKGMLLKPEGIQGLPYFGEKWDAYKKYNAKREPTDAQARRLIDFTKLVNQADDDAFKKKIAGYLDVDGFLRFMAANSLISNLDSFFGLGHNYMLYLNPKTNQFHFIPWDLDLSFGGFGMFGGDQTEWSIAQPYTGKNRLAERLLALKEYNEAYRSHLKTLTEKTYNTKNLNGQIAILEATVREAVAKEPVQKGGGFGFGPPGGGNKTDLRSFIAKRSDSVIAQLDGKSQGKVLAGGFGFGGGGKGPGFGGFNQGNNLAKPIIEASDTNKDGKLSLEEFKIAAGKLFKEAGGDDKKPVSEEALVDTINRLMPPPKGFGGFKPPAPPKGFGPGKGITGAMLKYAGTEKELTQAQFMTGAEKLFKQWDKDKKGALDEKMLADGINQFMPPPAFGPPGGFGPPPGVPDPKKDPPAKK